MLLGITNVIIKIYKIKSVYFLISTIKQWATRTPCLKRHQRVGNVSKACLVASIKRKTLPPGRSTRQVLFKQASLRKTLLQYNKSTVLWSQQESNWLKPIKQQLTCWLQNSHSSTLWDGYWQKYPNLSSFRYKFFTLLLKLQSNG